jgi:hypothetical protein
VIPWPQPKPDWDDRIVLPETVSKWPPLPGDPDDRFSLEGLVTNPALSQDWLLNPTTVLEFDNVLIGPAGHPGLQIISNAGVAAAGKTVLNANPGSALGAGMVVALADSAAFAESGLAQGGGLNIVRGAGYTSAFGASTNGLNTTKIGAELPGVDSIGG